MRMAKSHYGGCAAYALMKGNAGGNEPKGNLAVRSPAFSFSAASRNAATKAEYDSQKLSRAAFVAAW